MSHGHQHFHNLFARQVEQRDVTTIDGQAVSVVYVTESPTFNGVIGGYSTNTGGNVSPATTGNAGSDSAGPASPSASINNNSFPEAATATGLPTTSRSVASPSRSLATSSSNTAIAGPAVTPSSTSSSNTNSNATADSSSAGMSTGAKAGVAIGIIAVIGVIAALLLFCIGKKKKERKAREAAAADDEKTTFGASRNAIGMQSQRSVTSGPAPRLSIRPMSKNLLGDFGFGGTHRRSAGNLLNTVGENNNRTASPSPQPREQPPAENPFADPQNPFADPEKGVMSSARNAPPMAAAPPMMATPPANNADRIAFTGSWPTAPSNYDSQSAMSRDMPRAAPAPAPAPVSVSEPDDLPIMGASTPIVRMPSPTLGSSATVSNGGVAAASGAAVVAGAAAAAVASSKKHERRPEPTRPLPQSEARTREEPRERIPEPRMDDTREPPRQAPREAVPSPGPVPSPAFAAAAAGPVPNSPAASTASSQASAQNGGNVYRVIMDFVPSMDDELEMKSGSLVRMLHEYDDGWALCIRLDRSHQGVAPRTCLAAKPSKPKPSHLGQYARGPGPQGRPMSPAGDPRGRPMTPNGGRNSPAMNRPMSPGMGRPMSPGMGRPMSPAGGPMRPMSPGGRQMRPMSPAGARGPGRQRGPPGSNGSNRPMSPGGYNQAPRPLSPGPMRGGPHGRSQSPGPYGAAGPLPMPSAPIRRRSNSASAMNFQDRRMSPPGPSRLGMGQGMRPMSPAGMGMAI